MATPNTYMTGTSPFPAHVQSYLYSGKVITLVDHVGVNVDMNRDTYRKVMECTESRMREQQFRYATKGTFAQQIVQSVRTRTRRKTKKVSAKPEAVFKQETIVQEVREDTESEAEEEHIVTMTDPLKPSQRLLDFLAGHKKTLSATVLPPVVGRAVLKQRRELRTLRSTGRVVVPARRMPVQSFHSILNP